MRQVFLDTEFVDSPIGPILLSIGIAAGDQEFYAELTRAEFEAIPQNLLSDFLRREVSVQLGLIPDAAATVQEMAYRLAAWITNLDEPEVEVMYDYNVDYLMIERLVQLMPEPISCALVPSHVGYLLDDPDGERAAESAWRWLAETSGLRRHHALADARALEARFQAVHSDT